MRTWREESGARSKWPIPDTASRPSISSRIYDPFFTTKGRAQGHRPRPPVTYGIIQEHGGSIEVSNRPGRRPPLPLLEPPAPGAAQDNPVMPTDITAPETSTAPPRAACWWSTTSWISAKAWNSSTLEGYAVELAQNGAEGLRMMKSGPTTWCCLTS